MDKTEKPDTPKSPMFDKTKLNRVLLGILVILIVGGVIFAIVSKREDSSNKQQEQTTQTPFDSLQSIQDAKDCKAGLEKLPTVEEKKPNLVRNEQISLSIATLQYRIECNLQLKKYDEALKAATELGKVYEDPATAATESEKVSLQDKIADIKQTKADDEFRAQVKAEAERLSQEQEKQRR